MVKILKQNLAFEYKNPDESTKLPISDHILLRLVVPNKRGVQQPVNEKDMVLWGSTGFSMESMDPSLFVSKS